MHKDKSKRQIKMKYLTLVFIMTLAVTPLTSQAGKVYKWVDESGNTQFSQFPPGGQKAAEHVTVKTQQSGSSSQSKEKLASMRQKLLESSVDRNTENEEEKENKEKEKIKAQNCENAKQRLRNLESNGRIYKILENGERHWYDVKGRAAIIKSAQKDVDKFCN
jgi:Skp family chaperone for outer membrane proteins